MRANKEFTGTSTDSFPAFRGVSPEKAEHRHYCSSCSAYWDHEEPKCANRGYAMSCPNCLESFVGFGVQ